MASIAQVAAVVPLARTLELDAPGTFLALAAHFAFLGFLLNAIEAVVFTRGPSPIRAVHWIGGSAWGLALAALALLVSQPHGDASLWATYADWFDERGGRAWLRIAYAALTYMVAYCLLGSATWPFVRRHYEDPASPLALRVPAGTTIVPLQLARGLVATLVVLPLVASSSRAGLAAWPALALTTSVTCALVPMLLVDGWPRRLRVAHALEITVFALLVSAAWCWFLGR